VEQQKSATDELQKMMEQFPTATISQLESIVAAKYSGTREGAEFYHKGLEYLSKLPTKGLLTEQREEAKSKREEEQLKISKGQLDIAAGHLTVDQARYNLERQKQVRETAEKEFDDYYQLLNSKEAGKDMDKETVNAIKLKMIDSFNERRPAGTPALTAREVTHWYSPWAEPSIQMSTAPSKTVDKFVGKKPEMASPSFFDKMMEEMQRQAGGAILGVPLGGR
jgi:hypothetical protein